MRVDIGGGTRLFFDVVGSGLAPGSEMVEKPTLLLLHGGPGNDHSLFRPWFDRFADTHQVVYLDHRGQGRSDERREPTGWNLDTWADDVVRFCAALEIKHPAVFGNSFGGFVAMRYASRHPDHPSKLVLSSTAARADLAMTLAAFERLGGEDARRIAEETLGGDPDMDTMERYNAVCLPLYTRRSDNLTEHPRRSWMNYRVMADWGLHEGRSYDLRPDLARISCPTLVLGGADDPMCPPTAFQEIVDTLTAAGTDVTATLFPDCGHGSYRDEPEATERILRDWLC